MTAAEPLQGGHKPSRGGEDGNGKASLCPSKPEPLCGDVEVSDRRARGGKV